MGDEGWGEEGQQSASRWDSEGRETGLCETQLPKEGSRAAPAAPGINPNSAVPPQEYNMYGWWVGELNSTVGIVPKDYLAAAYELEER